jgi:hypothetical protein
VGVGVGDANAVMVPRVSAPGVQQLFASAYKPAFAPARL